MRGNCSVNPTGWKNEECDVTEENDVEENDVENENGVEESST